MSGGLEVLALKEADVMKMLAASTHLGTQNADYQMLQYAYKRKKDGKATWLLDVLVLWGYMFSC